jgi:GNAT superfamily N-acetyltransferase
MKSGLFMDNILTVKCADKQDLPALRAMAEDSGKPFEIDYFETCLDLQDKGERDVVIAYMDGVAVGYAMLNWQPKYAPFKRLGIPEIQDLNVIRAQRRQGFATQIIQWCEDKARKKGHDMMGIAFGLHSSYGAAQRLYVRLGYVPDGEGANYDRKQIAFGEFKPVDDDLCLMLVRDL